MEADGKRVRTILLTDNPGGGECVNHGFGSCGGCSEGGVDVWGVLPERHSSQRESLQNWQQEQSGQGRFCAPPGQAGGRKAFSLVYMSSATSSVSSCLSEGDAFMAL